MRGLRLTTKSLSTRRSAIDGTCAYAAWSLHCWNDEPRDLSLYATMVVLERGARGSGRSQILLLRVIFAVDATFYRTNAMLVHLWLVASPGISLSFHSLCSSML